MMKIMKGSSSRRGAEKGPALEKKAGSTRFIRGIAGVAVTAALLTGGISYGQVSLINGQIGVGAGTFKLSDAKLLTDSHDAAAVYTYTKLFAQDIKRVTGKEPQILNQAPASANVVIAGTLEGNQWIKALVRAGKINVDSIKGAWERYGIFLVKSPFKNVKQALVIAGSDRRSVAFGLFGISREIGVSPWYFWADVPIKKRSAINLAVSDYISPAPSVKYRGVFINDEDWGLRPWARDNYEKDLHNIGPKTYRQVFELLLRLNGNYLCPAMHPGSSAFNKYPENKVIADSFGIVMGSTHPEPLLFNNASEWDKKTMGEWDYKTNRDGIMKVLDKRVKENSPYENVYTLALRGLHDKEMQGNYPMSERLKLVEEALNDQRSILKKHIDTPMADIPQIFVPYKEVLDIYNAGLKLPDEVTLVWPDDNYGYLKQLSNETERKRAGHSGVYYHASYLGMPHDYLWLATTPPNLMYEELHKAYATGADRYWLLNAGDIKSCEAPVTQFLSMAYQLDSFSFEKAPSFQAQWLSKVYGQQYFEKLARITKEYNRLAFSRKPEGMAWGFEWNSHKNGRERATETEYSFDNYNEAEKRIADYLKIQQEAKDIYDQLPEAYKPSFYELVLYPVTGASLMNRMWLTAQKQRSYYYENNAAANRLIKEVDGIYDSLHIITKQYNSLLDGKWNHVISLVNGVTASYFEKPKLKQLQVPASGRLRFRAESAGSTGVDGYNNILPAFDKLAGKTHYFDIYNTGGTAEPWSAKASAPWIKLSATSGNVQEQQRIMVSVDWAQFQGTGRQTAVIDITTKKGHEQMMVAASAPDAACEALNGLFVEENGFVSIPAAGFQRKVENSGVKMQLIPDLGYTDTSVMMGSPVLPVMNPKNSNASNLQYDFYTFHRGVVKVYTYVLPTFPLSSNRDFGFHEASTSQTTYGVSIDDGAIDFPSSSAPEYSQQWLTNVARNAAVNVSTLYIDKPGKHTLKIITGDPGIVVQKIVIDLGGLNSSYMGPASTKVNCGRARGK